MRYDFAIVLVKVPIRADCDPWMRDARSHKLRFRYMRDRDVRAGTNGDGRCNRKAPTIIASFFCSAVLKVISPRDVSELLRRGDLEVIQRSAFDRGIKGVTIRQRVSWTYKNGKAPAGPLIELEAFLKWMASTGVFLWCER